MLSLRQTAALVGFGLGVALGLQVGGCSTLRDQLSLPPTSLQTLEYYPRLVKGYQSTYPPRRILVLLPVDARQFRDPTAADHSPDGGNPAIGVTLGRNDEIVQRLYSAPLAAIVQKAIGQSVEEAGMVPLNSPQISYASIKTMDEDYVIESRIARCWVKKRRGQDGRYGPTWLTGAEFGLDVKIYKPPFHTPFWDGNSPASYDDPPLRSAVSPEDETGIYDEPGQVLSIALTRAVAGIFRREDLRELISQDVIVPRRN